MSDFTEEIKGLRETQEKVDQVIRDLRGEPMLDGMRDATLLVTSTARVLAPADTGRLRASIQPEVRSDPLTGSVTGIVGSNVEYACIFDARTVITTEKGSRTIGQIQVGERVLTQDGQYHPIIAKNAFPAIQKPQLVDIEVPWRKGKNHKLTVTADHKILVYREGRNKWIAAYELLIGDQLYTRKKTPHNKDTAVDRICANCGKKFKSEQSIRRGNTFCSVECRNVYWYEKGNNPHIGMKRSVKTRQKIASRAVNRYQNHPETHPNYTMSQRGFMSSHERQIAQWLDEKQIVYEKQKFINGHWLDFYVPATNTAYEADGAYWHQSQAVDIERDKQITEAAPDMSIVHIHFFDGRFSPQLQLNPLSKVYYVPVNPGMSSYADPEQFETKPVVNIRHWDYVRKNRSAFLYDLTVETSHSFFANGILVSNSYMELGTKPHFPPLSALEVWAQRHGTTAFVVARAIARRGLKPREFLKGGVEQNESKIIALIGDAVSKIVEK